jgi:hypothetical protein
MILSFQRQFAGFVRPRRAECAFTLTSLLVGSALTILVMGGVLSVHFFGMKICQITETKLGANTEARFILSRVINDAKTAQKWRIGNWTSGAFVEVPLNNPLSGGAVVLYPVASDTNYIRYYYDSADGKLKRYTSSPAATKVLGEGVANTAIFSAQDFSGTIISNKISGAVLAVDVQFTKLQNPSVNIGAGQYYTSYHLTSKTTFHAAD